MSFTMWDGHAISLFHAKPYPVLQEFAPQTKLLSMIPRRAQKMLQNIDINLTSVDVSENYIALGSSIGIVYLYDREKDDLLKLRNEDHKNAITCVKLLVSLECMVLCGSVKGIVIAFKIPFSDPTQMEKFTVDGLHNGPIRALEWSPNGVKFFSGDSTGVVVCTEIDHLEHCSASRVILNETEEIVQLSYTSMILLVSTLKRSLLCHFKDNKLCQVGQKARKFPGRFGAVFFTKGCDILYASRPGHHIWKSDFNGFIMETMIFKDAFNKPHQHIHLQTETMAEKYAHFQFGPLKIYKKKYLVTWSGNMLVVIDPELSAIVSSCSLLQPVVDVACSGDEIFIIEGNRLLRRIATQPESIKEPQSSANPKEDPEVLRRGSQMSTSIVIKETPKLFDWLKNKISTISHEEETKLSLISEEVDVPHVLPDVVKLSSKDCKPLQLTTEGLPEITKELKLSPNIYTSRSKGIVLQPKKRKKKKKKEKTKKDNTELSKGDLTVSSTGTQHEENGSNPPENDVNVPNAGSVNESSTTEDAFGDTDPTSSTSVVNNLETNSPGSVSAALMESESPCDSSPALVSSSHHGEDRAFEDSKPRTSLKNEEENYVDETNKGPVVGIYSKYSYDADDSKLCAAGDKNSPLGEDLELSIAESSSSQMTDSLHSNESSSSEIPQYSTDWVQYKAPGPVVSLCVSDTHIFCVDSSDSLYISEFPGFGLSWVELNQPAHQVAVSPSEAVVWVLYNKTVYSASRKSEPWTQTQWKPIVRDVFYVAVHDDSAWYVTTSGKLMLLPLSFSTSSPIEVSIPWLTVKQIACMYGVVWALNVDGHLYCRLGISTKNKTGKDWKKIELPELASGTSISNIGLGDNKIGWIIDTKGTIWFRAGVSDSMPDGFNTLWQVETSEYLYQSYSQIHKTVWKVINSDALSSLIGVGEHQVFIAAGEKGVWFCKALETVLHANQKNVIGHSWDLVTLKGCASSVKWRLISAGNVTHNQGIVWCIDSTGDLFCFSEHSRDPLVVELPSSDYIRCLEATPESLWLLTDKSEIYVRREISPDNPQGVWWHKLDLDQLRGVRLSCISCSSEVVWACDIDGQVYVRVGTLNPSIGLSLTQAWVPVDSSVTPPSPKVRKFAPIGKQFPLTLVHSAKHKAAIAKVYVGPKSFMVWAVDDRNNVYVRDGITPNLLLGEKWVFVPGLHARELCLSKDTVWVLKPSGKIFRRYGITESNLMGDYWKQIPGKQSHFSVTTYDDLWGLWDGSIHHHMSFPIQHHQPPERKLSCGSVSDDDWENLAPSCSDQNY